MGSPRVYYLRALQLMAGAIAYETDTKLADELREELSEERLIAYLTDKKAELSEKDFYYVAGRATQATIEEAYEEGCDPFNASIGGINMFEDFIGLEDCDEE
jgi:hypothetical protein